MMNDPGARTPQGRAIARRADRIDVSAILAQIEATPEIERLRALNGHFGQADAETVAAIVDEAAQFCAIHLAPVDAAGDRAGARLVAGRVQTPPGYQAAWRAYVDAGWPTLDHDTEVGGQGLPLFLASVVQQLVDSSCAAFGMLPVLQRSAARLIAAYGSPELKAEWLSPLVRGEWAASICISEAEAGSDAGRLKTRAESDGEDGWTVSGEKMWISFGDHDLTSRIGHCVLARTASGLSLFLAPSEFSAPDGSMRRNAVVVRRLEEKMGLHGSPTCALGFEGAKAYLIGEEGRGLQQLFVMIANMRLSAGVQGLGIAARAADLAHAYAWQRRQGGSPKAPPVPIAEHADVQSMLMDMISRVEVVRGLGLAIAVQVDLAAHETDQARRTDAGAFVQWLLPVFKTIGGECGFDVASLSMQVLGGAGYTREWPVEQLLRDARIATIYEGTTGMQALDLLHRRLWRDNALGLAVFLRAARQDIAGSPERESRQLALCLDMLEGAAETLISLSDNPREAEANATAFLQLAGLAATGWIGLRLARLAGDSSAVRRIVAAGRYWLADLPERARLQHARSIRGARPLDLFAEMS